MKNYKEDPPLREEAFGQKIVRATNWNDLFTSPQAAWQGFLEQVVGRLQSEYEGNHDFRGLKVKRQRAGDLYILERNFGWRTVCQKLRNGGNVVLIFQGEDTNKYLITPEIGNIAHPFTSVNTFLPKHGPWEDLSGREFEELTGTHPLTLALYLRGKSAYRYWEETFLRNNCFPQRIGYEIYPDFALAAQARLMETYPQAFPNLLH